MCRKLVVVECYFPPNYDKKRESRGLEFITDTVIDMKRRFEDPHVVVAGDFNQWMVDLSDLADIGEVAVGNTRKDKCIDRIFTNMTRSIKAAGILAPLETEDEDNTRKSDHRVAFCTVSLPWQEAFRWESYSYRHYCAEVLRPGGGQALPARCPSNPV